VFVLDAIVEVDLCYFYSFHRCSLFLLSNTDLTVRKGNNCCVIILATEYSIAFVALISEEFLLRCNSIIIVSSQEMPLAIVMMPL
jgi:hypothetical protein